MNNYLALYSLIKLCIAKKVSPAQIRGLRQLILNNREISYADAITNSTIKAQTKNELLFLQNTFREINLKETLLTALLYLEQKDQFVSGSLNNEHIIASLLTARFGDTISPWEKLTLSYDNLTTFKPYAMRVDSVVRMESFLSNQGLNPIDSHICQISLDESISQSIKSRSGGDYEARINDLLLHLRLNPTSHVHEEDNPDQEHDFTFELDGMRFGIGAKRTLRERYKQYNPGGVDVSIVFTIGLDLNNEKCNTITNNYNSVIFVADEVYELTSFMQENPKVFRTTDFTIETLRGIL